MFKKKKKDKKSKDSGSKGTTELPEEVTNQPGRNNLLGDIGSFSKTNLNQAETNDRSAPQV